MFIPLGVPQLLQASRLGYQWMNLIARVGWSNPSMFVHFYLVSLFQARFPKPRAQKSKLDGSHQDIKKLKSGTSHKSVQAALSCKGRNLD